MSWETYRHRCQVRVRFGDTDPYGIVYFVSYFRYCHQAIEEFLRSLGLPPEETFRNVAEGFGLPIVEAHGKFLRPTRYGDLLEIETRIQELRSKAIIFHFRFFPSGGNNWWPKAQPTWWPSAGNGEPWRCRNECSAASPRLARRQSNPGKTVDHPGAY